MPARLAPSYTPQNPRRAPHFRGRRHLSTCFCSHLFPTPRLPAPHNGRSNPPAHSSEPQPARRGASRIPRTIPQHTPSPAHTATRSHSHPALPPTLPQCFLGFLAHLRVMPSRPALWKASVVAQNARRGADWAFSAIPTQLACAGRRGGDRGDCKSKKHWEQDTRWGGGAAREWVQHNVGERGGRNRRESDAESGRQRRGAAAVKLGPAC